MSISLISPRRGRSTQQLKETTQSHSMPADERDEDQRELLNLYETELPPLLLPLSRRLRATPVSACASASTRFLRTTCATQDDCEISCFFFRRVLPELVAIHGG